MIKKGFFSLEAGGKTVGFKFGIMAAKYTEEISNEAISSVSKRIIGGPRQTEALLHYFYGGAASFASSKSLPVPTLDEIADILDAVGVEAVSRIFNESIQGPADPNLQTQEKEKENTP